MSKIHFYLILLLVLAAGCNSASDSQKADTSDVSDSSSALNISSEESILQGTYKGLLPCLDCDGIRTTLVLQDSNKYRLHTQHGDIDEEVLYLEGTYQWEDSSSLIVLENGQEGLNRFIRKEDDLFLLGADDQVLDSKWKDSLKLSKVISDIADIEWKLETIKGQKLDQKGSRPVTFILDTKNGIVRGFLGCNGYSGEFELDGNTLNMYHVFITDMACEDLDLESELRNTLFKTNNYALRDSQLVLKEDDTELVVFTK